MIQDIHPHQFSNEYIATTNIQDNDYIFHFKGRELLLKQNGERVEFPRKSDMKKCCSQGIFLFTLNNTNCFLIYDSPTPAIGKFNYHEITHTISVPQKEIDWASVLAYQIMSWYDNNKFCGKCGGSTEVKTDERAIFCPKCNIIQYPNIPPAIIVAIICNDNILLAQGVNFRNRFYSLIAGYVEVGESIENTIHREVKEEVGIDIKNIRYYGSQPWPFSSSMMIGFIAEAEDTQPIRIDEKEIVHAQWFSRNNLPEYPLQRSIAGEIIQKFERGEL